MKLEYDLSRTMRVALVHDWLTGMRGGEKVLDVLCELFPHATLFTLLHNRGAMSETIERMEIRTSFIDRLPLKTNHYRRFLPFFPRAIETFDLSGYDLVLSTSHCVAKGAIPAPQALHICYCHTPMRYVWELYDEYFGPGRAGLLTRTAMRYIAPRLRRWDAESSRRVHHFVANSANVARRISRYYGRNADVIHAPVDISRFRISGSDDGFYLIVSALVPYKRIDLAIELFARTGERLVIVGTGPDEKKLKELALRSSVGLRRGNIEFLGWQPEEKLADLYAGCRAVIFPGAEDFGIVPLEAMASGKPVVAYGRGGALETVVQDGPAPTGVLFYDQTLDALNEAVGRLKRMQFDPAALRAHAQKFDRPVFKEKIGDYILAKLRAHGVRHKIPHLQT